MVFDWFHYCTATSIGIYFRITFNKKVEELEALREDMRFLNEDMKKPY
jgi:hypothetical protein